MTKTDLIQLMSKNLDSQKEAQSALESLLSAIGETLKKGESVSLAGFGTFKVSKRNGRKGRNPQTGEEIQIPPKDVVRFLPGKHLKDAIN